MKLVALLATFVLVMAACSSDDGGSDTTEATATTAAPTTTAAPAPTTTLAGAVEGEWCNSGASAVAADSTAGAGDELLIFQWQAPSQANALISNGTKDILAASLVSEPLIEIDPDGQAVPKLATEVPSVSNGGISEDGLTMTFNLVDCVLWSDGTPFTSADVVFSHDYCLDLASGCSAEPPTQVTAVTAVNDLTVEVTFDVPQPYPFIVFTGSIGPILQKAQMEPCIGAAAAGCTDENFKPIGTGPFMVTELRAEDTVLYVSNPLYRFAAQGKPWFSTVQIKGGGDAEASARSVLEIGEGDYAWNLQVAPEILTPMEAAGNGRVVGGFGSSVEHINLNGTNPDGPTPGEFGDDLSNKNPFFFENVLLHDALSIAIDRDAIVAVGYGGGGTPTCNMWPVGDQGSPNNEDVCTYDPVLANKMLDDGGYLDTNGDGVRETPDGLELSWEFLTSTNAVRQSTQDLVKAYWKAIGVEVEMTNADAGLFFDGTCASDDCIWKFFTDIQMFTNNSSLPFAATYLNAWVIDELPTAAKAWGGGNLSRMYSEAYDEAVALLEVTALDDPELNANIWAVNDLLVEWNLIPLVSRGSISGISNEITGFGDLNAWSSEYWNVEEWVRE